MGRTLPLRRGRVKADPTPPGPDRIARVAAMGAEILARRKRTAAPITSILPRERVLMLAGKPRRVNELRLCDLADLQQWMADQVPNPLDSLPDPADVGEDAYREALKAAWMPAREWPPKLGTAEGNAILATKAGSAAFVFVCLRRCDELVTAEDAIDCAAKMTADEWAALRRVAWGTPPWREVHAELVPDDGRPSPPMDWAEAFATFGQGGFGGGFVHPEAIAGLTLSQWRAYRTGRADVYQGVSPMPGETLEDARDRERSIFGPAGNAEATRIPTPDLPRPLPSQPPPHRPSA